VARVVIVGAGIGGLGAALALAGTNHDVTVVEQDPPPPTTNGDVAFEAWDRRRVPQFRQAHGFSARSRNLLKQHAPRVLDRLAADGIRESNTFKMLAPPELHRVEDDEFTGFMTRRPAFELALRLEAQDQPRIRFECPTTAVGLLVTFDSTCPPIVVGIRVDGGREIRGDLVLDAAGRRSPISRWLSDVGIDVHEDMEECGVSYFSRYFRRRPESALPIAAIFGIRAAIDHLLVLGFTGDHDTYAITFAAASWDEELSALRHEWAWEATAASIPSVAPWVSSDNATPVAGVATMTGHRNVRRRYVVDDRPAVLGLLSIGDALCTTNPAYGWGASMALTYAFVACDAINAGMDDLEGLAIRYYSTIANEADGVYEESASSDRIRTYRWKGMPIPSEDQGEADHHALIEDGVLPGILRDEVLGRAFLRRVNLLDPPRALFDDPEVVARAMRMREKLRSKPVTSQTPTREAILDTIGAARPFHSS
jgi:2-polyprenyl-6-methoxyphenol hydroxylase-like FAD-dependent oxidoreductase